MYVFDASERRYVRVEGRREQAQLKIDRSFVLDCRDEFYLVRLPALVSPPLSHAPLAVAWQAGEERRACSRRRRGRGAACVPHGPRAVVPH